MFTSEYFPHIMTHLENKLYNWVKEYAELLLYERPELSENRALGIAAAIFLATYRQEWVFFTDIRKTPGAMNKDIADGLFWATQDKNADHDSVYDQLERYNRSLGLEAEYYTKYGMEYFEKGMGRYDLGWRHKR